MTKEEILKMEAGPEIDALFAERVMEFDVYKPGENYVIRRPDYIRNYVPNYSTNISHAMEGVEKVQERYQVVFRWFCFSQKWECVLKGAFKWKPFCLAEAETASLAITRALILWAMEKEATNESKPRGD